MMQKSIQLSCALAITGVILAGCGDTTLFQAPPRGSEAIPPPVPSDSVITLVAKATYTALNQAAETKIPRSVPLSGDGHVACLDIPYVNPGYVGSHEECINKPYVDFRVVGLRGFAGMYRISRGQASAREISAPTITGMRPWTRTARFRRQSGYRHASILSLSGKSFDVRVAAATDLNVGLNNQYVESHVGDNGRGSPLRRSRRNS